MITIESDIVKSNIKLANISNGVSSSLYNNYKDEAYAAKDKLDKSYTEMLACKKSIDSIYNILPTIDSTTFLNYYINFKVIATKKDLTIVRDSGYYIINKDFKIEKLN